MSITFKFFLVQYNKPKVIFIPIYFDVSEFFIRIWFLFLKNESNMRPLINKPYHEYTYVICIRNILWIKYLNILSLTKKLEIIIINMSVLSAGIILITDS